MGPYFRFFFLLSIFIFAISCGVKGPPLPPIPLTPQKSEDQKSPNPDASRSPISVSQ